MHEDLIKRLRELQALAEHCDEQSCDECKNIKLCDKYDNKTLSRTYKEAVDAIEGMNRRIDRAIELYNRNVEKSAMYEDLAGISPEPPKEESS